MEFKHANADQCYTEEIYSTYQRYTQSNRWTPYIYGHFSLFLCRFIPLHCTYAIEELLEIVVNFLLDGFMSMFIVIVALSFHSQMCAPNETDKKNQ